MGANEGEMRVDWGDLREFEGEMGGTEGGFWGSF